MGLYLNGVSLRKGKYHYISECGRGFRKNATNFDKAQLHPNKDDLVDAKEFAKNMIG